MQSREYERKRKEELPVIAICYDLFSLSDMMSRSSGRNLTALLRTTTWIRTLPICSK